MRWLIPLALVLLAGAAKAEETAPVGLITADEVKGWQAVGKLLIGNRGFCTGVLIAPQRVLTAAHCLYDKETGARIGDSEITFEAGWRNGRADAYRGVRRSYPHPDYIYSGEEEMDRVAYDIAVLDLDQPILLPQLIPFSVDAEPDTGATVSVVSYAKDRSEIPSIEKDCAVLAATRPALILSCNIDFGSSGAPVFSVADGIPKVVSVISAKAEMEGRKVALAVPLAKPLGELVAQIDSEAAKSDTGVTVLRGGLSGGAKFLSP